MAASSAVLQSYLPGVSSRCGTSASFSLADLSLTASSVHAPIGQTSTVQYVFEEPTAGPLSQAFLVGGFHGMQPGFDSLLQVQAASNPIPLTFL